MKIMRSHTQFRACTARGFRENKIFFIFFIFLLQSPYSMRHQALIKEVWNVEGFFDWSCRSSDVLEGLKSSLHNQDSHLRLHLLGWQHRAERGTFLANTNPSQAQRLLFSAYLKTTYSELHFPSASSVLISPISGCKHSIVLIRAQVQKSWNTVTWNANWNKESSLINPYCVMDTEM